MIDYLAGLPWWAWLWLLAALVLLGTICGIAFRSTFVPERWRRPVVWTLGTSFAVVVVVPAFFGFAAFFYLATGSMP